MYNFIIQTVKSAGQLLLKSSRKGFVVEAKNGNSGDIVTSTDKEVNEFIIKKVQEKFPKHSIYSEEGGTPETSSENQWIIDPIDGSANFSRGIPHFAVCLGLLKSGVPIAGAVYNPITRELFSFEKGRGAFLNGKPIKVSKNTKLSKAHIFFHAGRNPLLHGWGGESYRRLLSQACKTKNFSGASLDICFVAAGRIEANISGNMSTLDIAPALGILREAGGLATGALGKPLVLNTSPQKIFVANNKIILNSLLKILR